MLEEQKNSTTKNYRAASYIRKEKKNSAKSSHNAKQKNMMPKAKTPP